jgi:hypothetical protein
MARSRNIKPGFFKNELLVEIPPETRLLFIGLWCLADREGRFEDRPKKIKMELFPCDNFSIEDSLALLAENGFLLRYEVDGKRYAQVVNFTKHQMPHHKEVPSEIPAPPGCAQVTKHSYDVSKETREEVFARDKWACLKCKTKDDLSIDHIVPLAAGGDNATTNLQTLCKSCNSSKGNSTKDHRQLNIEPTLNQRQGNVGAPCPSDSLIPDSLIPDSLIPFKTPPPLAGDVIKTPAKRARVDKPGDYTPEFDDAWAEYPPRPGHSKAEAWKAWKARLQAGATVEAMADGIRRYAAYVKACSTEQKFIKHAATFLGPDTHYLNDWSPPKAAQNGNSILGKTGQATAANALRWLEKVEQREATDAGI